MNEYILKWDKNKLRIKKLFTPLVKKILKSKSELIFKIFFWDDWDPITIASSNVLNYKTLWIIFLYTWFIFFKSLV